MKILGIGQALIDVFAFVDQEIPITFGLDAGRFNRIPDYKIKAIITTLKNSIKMAGGMSANIVKLTAQMGLSCSFSGCVGTDQEGQLFEKELIDTGVRLFLQKIPGSSEICVIFLTPAQKNTLATFSSATNIVPSYDICEMAVQENELVVLESHLLENEDFFDQILQLCWTKKCQVCLSLGTSEHFNERNKEKIVQLIHQGRIHYLFLKGKADQDKQEQELLKALSPILKGFVVNRSLLGCVLYHEGQMIKISWPNGHIVDKTGTHDALVAGYLWAVAHKLNPVQSAQCGVLAASALSQVVGTKLKPEQIAILSHKMNLLRQKSYKTVE